MQYIRGDKIFYHKELSDYLDNNIVNPITMEIHLTNRCNMKCNYCFFADRDKNLEMTDVETFKCIDALKSIGVKGLIFSGGGEPTVHKNFKDIVLYASNCFDIALITNGLVDISDIVNKFVWVRYSLDAVDKHAYRDIKGVDKFEKVNKNIIKAIEKKDSTTIGIQMVITKDNYKDIFEVYAYTKKIGADYFQFRPLENAEYSNYMWSEINNARDYFNRNSFPVITTENKWIETF